MHVAAQYRGVVTHLQNWQAGSFSRTLQRYFVASCSTVDRRIVRVKSRNRSNTTFMDSSKSLHFAPFHRRYCCCCCCRARLNDRFSRQTGSRLESTRRASSVWKADEIKNPLLTGRNRSQTSPSSIFGSVNIIRRRFCAATGACARRTSSTSRIQPQ